MPWGFSCHAQLMGDASLKVGPGPAVRRFLLNHLPLLAVFMNHVFSLVEFFTRHERDQFVLNLQVRLILQSISSNSFPSHLTCQCALQGGTLFDPDISLGEG